MSKERIFLVDGKRVAIIKAYEHTYHVRFLKSGKFMEINKKYLISWTPGAKKKKAQKTEKSKTSIQTSIKF